MPLDMIVLGLLFTAVNMAAVIYIRNIDSGGWKRFSDTLPLEGQLIVVVHHDESAIGRYADGKVYYGDIFSFDVNDARDALWVPADASMYDVCDCVANRAARFSLET